MKHWPIGVGAWLPPFLLLAWSGSAAAEDARQEDRVLEHVQVTATRRPADVFDVAAAASLVRVADILRDAPDVLAESLRGQPGVYFQQTTPGQGIPIIRGLKGSQVLHLVDGMRLNNAFFRSAPNQYMGLVDPYMGASIEVVRGASGTLYGSDAMGGVVQVVNPDLFTELEPDARSTQLFGRWNSVESGWATRVAHRARSTRTALQAGFSYQDRGDRRNGAGETLSPSGFRSRAADLQIQHRIDDLSEFRFSAQLLEQPSTPRIDEMTAGFDQAAAASSEFFFEPNERRFTHVRYRREDGAWFDRFSFNLARQVIDDDRRSRDLGSNTRTLEQNRSTLDGLTLQVDHELGTDTWLTWGFERYQDTVRSARQQLDITGGRLESAGSRFPDGSTMDSSAAYTSWEWRPLPNLDVVAGARYSRFDIDLAASADAPAAQLGPDNLSGDLHLAWAFSEQTHLVTNIGRSFRAPNIFDLGSLGERPGNRFNAANPGLQPETAWSYDLGIKHAGAALQAELFVFLLEYEDKITSVLTGETTASGREIVRSENRDRARLYGIEAGLSWELNERLDLQAALNLTRGTEHDDSGFGQDADRIPPLNGYIGLDWQASEGFTVAARWQFASRQDRLSDRDVQDPRIDPAGTPGWGSLELSLEWSLSDRVDVGLVFENLGDKHYREHASGIDAAGRNFGAWLAADF